MANFIQKLLGAGKEQKAHIIHSGFGSGAFAPPEMNARAQLNSYFQWTYAAAKAIAEEVASIDLKLYRLRNGDVEEIEEHEILALLNAVNPYQSKYDFFFLLQLYKELTGEAFMYLERGQGASEKSPVRELWLLRPDLIDVVPDPVTFVKGYIYRTGTDKMTMLPHEVIQHKYPSPTNPYRGYSPITAASYAIDTHRFASEHNRNFFYNNARPDGVLETTNPLNDQQYERLKHEWQAAYGGRNNSHRVALMEAGVKYSQVTMSAKDMDFLQQMQMTRDEILAVYKVPKSIVGMTEDMNRSTAETADYVFASRTIKPKMQQLVDTLNEFFVPLWGDDLYLDFEDPTPENKELELKEYQAAHNRWLTTNEIRQEEGLDPIEGGDEMGTPLAAEGNFGRATLGMKPAEKKQKAKIAKTLKARSKKLRQKEELRRQLKAVQEKKAAMTQKQEIQKADQERAALLHEIAKVETQLEYAEEKLKQTEAINTQLQNEKEAAEELAAEAAGIKNHADETTTN